MPSTNLSTEKVRSTAGTAKLPYNAENHSTSRGTHSNVYRYCRDITDAPVDCAFQKKQMFACISYIHSALWNSSLMRSRTTMCQAHCSRVVLLAMRPTEIETL